MKKLFSVVMFLLFLVVAVWLSATHWSGIKTEEQYHAFLRQASQWQYLKLVNESYDRGLLESKARTIVEIDQPSGAAAGDQPIRLTLAHKITHGPFPVSTPDKKWRFQPLMAIIETTLVISTETRTRLAELYAQIPELASTRDYTIIYLDGHGEQHLSIPAFQHTLGDKEKVAVVWKGLSLQVNFAADLKGFSGSLSIPGLEAAGTDINLKIEDIKSTFDSHEGISGLALGDASFHVAGLDFAAKQEKAPLALLIRAFNVQTSSKASGDVINCLFALKADQLTIDGNQYGPGIFELELRNLDAASLASLQQMLGERPAQTVRQSPEAAQMAMLARFGEILPGLLRKSPEMELRQLDLKTTMGDFSGKAKIAFDGTQPGSTQNLLALATALTAEAEFTVGERLLRHALLSTMKEKLIERRKEHQGKAPNDQDVDAGASAGIDEQLNTLTAQNILVKSDGEYRASASYKAGQMVLNGRPLSLQDLMR
jgi:uncharacterized protein YdgA (DUF945 family)